MRKLPAWMTTPQTVSGEWLQQAGLALPILDPKRHSDWSASTRVMVSGRWPFLRKI